MDLMLKHITLVVKSYKHKFGLQKPTSFNYTHMKFEKNHFAVFLSVVELLSLVIKLLVIVDSGLLVLLVLGDQGIHVGLGLCELHLVHAFTSVPMEESLAPEHSGELLRDPLEELLDGSGVTDEGRSHLKTTRRNITHGSLDVVGDPLHEVAAVLVLDVQHLLVHLLHGHTATEHGSDSQIASMSGVAGGHHVLGVKHLLGELGHAEGPVLLGAPGGKGSESGHEEVETGEGD